MHTLTTRSGTKSSAWATHWMAALIVVLSAVTFIVFPPANTASYGLSSVKRKDVAKTEARHLLALATLPLGSRRISTWIAADGTGLAAPADAPNDLNHVDVTYYYLVPGGSSAFARLEHQVPQGGHLSAIGSVSGPHTGNVRFMWFTFRATSAYSNPELEYSTIVTSGGDLELRVDAFVSSPSPKSQHLGAPDRSTKAIATINRQRNVAMKTMSIAATTNLVIINQFISKVNEPSAITRGAILYRPDVDASSTLSFHSNGAAHPYAAANT